VQKRLLLNGMQGYAYARHPCPIVGTKKEKHREMRAK
jgi:hypothetical protein